MLPLRRALPLALALALASPAASPPSSASAHRPAGASVTAVRVPAVASSARTTGSRVLAAVTRTRTTGFGLVGVTWDHASGSGAARVEVRTRAHGRWTGWTELDVDDEAAGEGRRDGTEPLWVGSATGVAVRMTGTGSAPRHVAVDLVDPGADPAGATSRRVAAAARVDGSPAYTPEPAMVSRASWGARANSYCDSPRYGSHTLGVVFHHTAGSNSYTRAQSAGIVRGIQAYHMRSRGWCDIGYNFLVDKYGQVFEGRSGGRLQQVRGAHAGNFDVNTYDMGVSMIGNLDTARPSTAMKDAAVKLIGWRLGTNYLPAKGAYSLDGKQLVRIVGHRDVYLRGLRPATRTACPGRYGYAWLRERGGLRDRVAAYIAHYSTPIRTRAAQLGYAALGYVAVGEYPTEGGYKTRFAKGDMYSKGSLGAHLVSGTIAQEYAAWDIQHGDLGFPTGDVVIQRVGYEASQRFEHGSIWRVPQSSGVNKGFGLLSGIDAEYRELGGFGSRLGSPTSRTTTTGDVDRATFQHGAISYDRTTGVATVTYS